MRAGRNRPGTADGRPIRAPRLYHEIGGCATATPLRPSRLSVMKVRTSVQHGCMRVSGGSGCSPVVVTAWLPWTGQCWACQGCRPIPLDSQALSAAISSHQSLIAVFWHSRSGSGDVSRQAASESARTPASYWGTAGDSEARSPCGPGIIKFLRQLSSIVSPPQQRAAGRESQTLLVRCLDPVASD
jgi:hypothetical protein